MTQRKTSKNVRFLAVVFLGLSGLPLNGCAPAALMTALGPMLSGILPTALSGLVGSFAKIPGSSPKVGNALTNPASKVAAKPRAYDSKFLSYTNDATDYGQTTGTKVTGSHSKTDSELFPLNDNSAS